MTENNDIRKLKILAKRYARANRIAQHQALDLMAGELGFPSWVRLVSASKNGWRPDGEQVAALEAFAVVPLPVAAILEGDAEVMRRRLEYLQAAEDGEINGHPYRLQEVLGDIIVAGEGWSIRVQENPSAVPVVETYTKPGAACPVRDPDFLMKALELARDRAKQVRAGLSTDWPRRSTKPDLDGVVRHPLSKCESNVWFCYHCDGKITGAQIAQNLWHCPRCGASPLDIFATASWADDQGKSFWPATSRGTAGHEEADVEIIDGRPKLELSAGQIDLLIRSALLDDATTVSERLGALQAEINVDQENGLWITLEVDLWPEDKEPVQALAVAKLLGLEVELECALFGAPFAWPGLGEVASNTTEYTAMMLDAYEQHGNVTKRKAKTS
ncbi:hypothetical protein [Mesorhizobium sp.]|uniref:hypothetical protein n=1 Tax=Mesorhizobium sp. TaxID=1871066 RepID=UPI0011F5399B|nr:hypothetical protein [Mesorhizobium sp.]TIP14306.1 MAG: hypothetical protein E5X73_05315 [Mesorhizobium sp.]